MDRKKILICGGHLSPALALIEELKEIKNLELVYVGRKYSLEGDLALSLEYKTINSLGVKFIELSPGRIPRVFSKEMILSLSKIPFGIIRSFIIISQEKPDIVLSFGGSVAFSLSIVAFFKKVNVVTHEQTKVMGLTNRIISMFARFTCLSWPDTKYAQNSKFIVMGNIIRKNDNEKEKSIIQFGNPNLPLLYITGGSQGSKSINEIVKVSLFNLLKTFRIIHQCGMADNSEDFRSLQKIKSSLPLNVKNNYSLWRMLSPSQAIIAIKSSDFIIGRSGANTVTEIATCGKPAIFIPLPWSADNEQLENAKWLMKKGSAIVLEQKDLTSDKFIKAVNIFYSNINNYQKYAVNIKKTISVDGINKFKTLIMSLIQ